MKEDDENPRCPSCGNEMRGDVDGTYEFYTCDDCDLELPHNADARCYAVRESYQKCYEHGQQNPSPQTIKKIEHEAVDNFAEKVKETLKVDTRLSKPLHTAWFYCQDVSELTNTKADLIHRIAIIRHHLNLHKEALSNIIDTLKEKEGEE